MAYQALYRKWRPQTFDAVVGQEAITDTLKNAIKRGKVSHAFLFAGPRGTGKTSCAKIFAKALNCLNLQDGEPCNECANCKAADEGAMPDILELDAASNNSVEDIRDLLSRVSYSPNQGRCKVYIIDEVHMLTMSAFNALLKTLEEPPESVVFILATTELQKVPATIISRTQRYNFKRISKQDLVKRMKYILDQEGIKYEDKALSVIAQVADGGMRDALSILDQLLSFEKEQLLYQDALEITGFAAREQIEKILLALFKEDAASALTLAKEAAKDGASPQNILSEIINLATEGLLAVKTQQDSGNFLTPDFYQTLLQVREGRFYQVIDQANDALNNLRFTNQQQIPLDVFLVKAASGQSVQKEPVQSQGPVAVTAADPRLAQQVDQLTQQVQALSQQVAHLSQGRANGVGSLSPNHVFKLNQTLFDDKKKQDLLSSRAQPGQSKAAAPSSRSFKSSSADVNAVLAAATRADLEEAKNLWERDLPSELTGPDQAALKFLEPIAAGNGKLLLKVKNDAWQVGHDPDGFLTELKDLLERFTKTPWTLALVEEAEWPSIRQAFIKEHFAKKAPAPADSPAEQPAAEATAAETGPVPPEAPDEAEPEVEPDNSDVVDKAREVFGDLVQVKD